jgi:DNA-binding IscR family transcriptional regulator
VNARFPVSVHILALLASRGGWVTSDEIAVAVQMNAVVVRRLVGLLQKAGIVRSKLGPGGGVRLALPPQSVSLACVLNAVQVENLLPPLPRSNAECVVSNAVESTLEAVRSDAHAALCASLQRRTLADVLERMETSKLEGSS